MFDFALAKAQHHIWNLKLRLFLKNQQSLKESEVLSPQHCQLGQWLYSQGLAEYGHIPEMVELEQVHAELHQTMQEVIHLKKIGETGAATQEFLKTYALNDRIAALLDILAAQLSQTAISP